METLVMETLAEFFGPQGQPWPSPGVQTTFPPLPRVFLDCHGIASAPRSPCKKGLGDDWGGGLDF